MKRETKRSQASIAKMEDMSARQIEGSADRAEHARFLAREHGPGGTVDPAVQRLFEKMADAYGGNVEMEHVYADGSARIRVSNFPNPVRRRLSVVFVGGEQFAKIEQIQKGRDPSPILVSPRPSAVLSLFEL
jgi:hypothetical protein